MVRKWLDLGEDEDISHVRAPKDVATDGVDPFEIREDKEAVVSGMEKAMG